MSFSYIIENKHMQHKKDSFYFVSCDLVMQVLGSVGKVKVELHFLLKQDAIPTVFRRNCVLGILYDINSWIYNIYWV